MPSGRAWTAIAAALLLAGAAAAETVTRPEAGQAGRVEIGLVAGTGYYTVDDDGLNLVLTLTRDEEQPVRIESVLEDGQSLRLSAPRERGADAQTIEFRREGDGLVVIRP